jgi:membrane-associated protein
LLGRFLPIIRTFVPIAAGAAKMPYRDFMTFNVLGAILWGGGVTYLGFELGRQIPDAEKYLLPIIIVVIILSLIPPLVHWWRQSSKKRT